MLAGCCLALAPSLSNHTHAQTADSLRDGSGVLEQMIISARKIAENQQQTPVAVTALDPDFLVLQHAQDLDDLNGIAPNVSIGVIPGFGSAAAISIRGVSTGDIPSTFDPAVSVVVDGFALGHAQTSLLDLFDIERIEILRGPQGTLFGKNTIGGVIVVTTQKPAETLGAEARVTVGNLGRIDVRAAADVPILDQILATRISFLSQNSSGAYTNLVNGEKLGGDSVIAIRNRTLFTPSDRIEFLLSVEFERDRSDTSGAINTSFAPQVFSAIGFPGNDPRQVGFVTNQVGQNGHFFDILGFYMNVEWRITESLTLTSISGYREVNSTLFTDFLYEPVVAQRFDREVDRDTWSHETRIAGEAGSFAFVAGGYYQSNDLNYFNTAQILGVLPVILTTNGRQDASAWALFGEADLSLTDKLRIIGGLRYTQENKDFALRLLEPDCELSPFPGCQLSAPEEGAETFDKVTWRVGADYRFTESIFGYVTYATGFKSGGFNEQANDMDAFGPFEEETAKSFEAGLKSEFLGRRLRINLAVFFARYDGLQLDTVIPAPNSPAGQTSAISNAGKSRAYGLEWEVAATPSTGLNVIFNGSFFENDYRDFETDIDPFDGVVVNEDATFLTPKRSPKWSLYGAATYRHPGDGWGSVIFNSSISYVSGFFNDTLNSEPGRADARALISASVSYLDPSERFEVSIFARNIFDKIYQSSGLLVANLFSFSTLGEPRTYGIEFAAQI